MKQIVIAVVVVSMALLLEAESKGEDERAPAAAAGKVAKAVESKASTGFPPRRKLLYKQAGDIALFLHGFYPDDLKKGDARPAIVFFHGGGWVCGKTVQFNQQARAFRDLGFVAFSANYRLINKHHTTVYECVKDGKSAVRWIRAHAKELGVDPNRIIAAGGSAGGHVAACTALIEGYEEEGDDKNVSCRPNALVLYSPVLDTTEKGYGADKMIKGEKTDLSPCHHVRKGLPPTILFHGTRDTTVPPENAERFEKLMKEAGNHCDRVPFEGRRHSFFNGSGFRRNNTDDDFNTTMEKAAEFLKSIGFIPKKDSTIHPAAKPS